MNFILERKKPFLILGFILIISGAVLSVLSIVFAINIMEARNSYLEEENIYYERFSVNVDDNINIQGIYYVNDDLKDKDDKSVPSILWIHGLNGRKERYLDKMFQFLKRGYAVFTVEQRGHGNSGGISTFINEEPKDMAKVLDYIEETHKFVNTSHMGLLAYSYGGGTATVLQAVDDRIYAQVIYHPLASIDRIQEDIPFERLIGITPAIRDVDAIEDGYDLSTPENTKNLLLLQGEIDDLILPKDTEAYYDKVNGSNRDDIAYETRPNLGHVENEHDEGSLKMAVAWMEHYYHDSSINITQISEESKSIKIFDFAYQNTSLPEDLLMIGVILLSIGLAIIIMPFKIWENSQENKEREDIKAKADDINKDAYKKTILMRSSLYLLTTLVMALILAFVNPSYIYGYLMLIPMVTIFLLVFAPDPNFSDWRAELKTIEKQKIKTLSYGLILIAIPTFTYILIYNLNAFLMRSQPIPFFTTTTLIYLSGIILTIMMDYMLIRGLPLRYSLILIGLRSLSLLIFFLIIPLPAFLYLGEIGEGILYILIISLVGVVMWVLHFLLNYIHKPFGSRIIILGVILVPTVIFLVHRFFRII